MRLAALAFSSVLLLVLPGCSAVNGALDTMGAAMRNPQEPAATEPHALIRISTDGYTFVQPGRSCESAGNPRGGIAVTAGSLYVGARGLQGQVRGVVGSPPPGLSSGELRLTAGEPQVLAYTVAWQNGTMQYSCHVARSFTPVAGAQYQMLTLSDAASRRCGLMVTRLAPEPGLVETTEAPPCTTP